VAALGLTSFSPKGASSSLANLKASSTASLRINSIRCWICKLKWSFLSFSRSWQSRNRDLHQEPPARPTRTLPRGLTLRCDALISWMPVCISPLMIAARTLMRSSIVDIAMPAGDPRTGLGTVTHTHGHAGYNPSTHTQCPPPARSPGRPPYTLR
jgi:hypothetical protein